MKELIIVAGPNDSGKTTFAKTLMRETQYEFLNVDEIKANLSLTDVEAGKIFFTRLKEYIQNNANFILESTLSGKYMKTKIEEAKSAGFRISIFSTYLNSPDDCIQRIKIRVKNGGHFVPDEDVRRRFSRSKSNFWNIYKGLSDDWTLIYNSSDQGSKRVAFGKANTFLIESNELFSKFTSNLIL